MKFIISVLCIAVIGVHVRAQNPILTNPEITFWGDWFSWEKCEDDTYASAFELKTEPYGGATTDDVVNTGIRFLCKNWGRPELGEAVISSLADTIGIWGERFSCGPGYITGFQMRSEASQGAVIDDTAGNNLRIFCDGDSVAYRQGDGGNFGTWTLARHCPAKHAFCGIRTQVEIGAGRLDETALNNFSVECCEIIHPAKKCEPEGKWERILSCNNMGGDSDKECVHETRAGVSYGSSNKYPGASMAYEKNGFKLEESIHTLKQNVVAKMGKDSVSGVSGLEKSGESSITLLPGHFSHVDQFVVSCGMYTMRTNQLKRTDVDSSKQTSASFYKF